jgi:hypothetical protein
MTTTEEAACVVLSEAPDGTGFQLAYFVLGISVWVQARVGRDFCFTLARSKALVLDATAAAAAYTDLRAHVASPR